ncbi:phosphoenolpyruvate synthase [Xylanibacillus composti]|uniref:Phosphoenolpyruvate synthase n=1 Tax=Xylanibacillus composti TaxID=1572762 RepID=A0A8J4M4K2_9BACL|nr:PEP/pyruvate-binding domain-containing protein [Xylanibacillus composti]GIQ71347.1 phosphoenolpyruvate synthase [Xylanibacillus composti]
MNVHEKVSTGLSGLDQAIDRLRLGDNVVWQVDSVENYKKMLEPYVRQARADQRKLIYVRFGSHEPLLEPGADLHICEVDASKGFESFATTVHYLVEQEGKGAFYVFDCLTDLLAYWHSDLMIGNFFKVACPYLYELHTIAYFAIIRNAHTYSTIAGIRETTQLLLDLYQVKEQLYVHPLKVWNRYSPTMFFPHLIKGQEAVCITASTEAAALFSTISRGEERLDYWNILFQQAKEALDQEQAVQEEKKRQLMKMLIGHESRMLELCDRYFTLSDILQIASREVGTGFIGGKSVGMLLARKILEMEGQDRFAPNMEPHDSFYLGSDVFYTYIVQNGWWKLRTRQKTREGYFLHAPELREKLLNGRFPENIQEQFVQILEYFGQSPIIVRSSSLLEDNFGNAFAGKYESVFCVNQGTPEERYAAFEQAIRTVYASTMNEDALHYRLNRGLAEQDEQMAILVQRVSGDHHGDNFYPHIAGVGNSSNLYVWDERVDMEAGMLRLVFGLGTRAVDRTVGDYVRIVSLDDPLRLPLMNAEDHQKFSQRIVDLLSLSENALTSRGMDEVLDRDLKTSKDLFASLDHQTAARLRELGYADRSIPYILDFHKLLKNTAFPVLMREMLALLSKVYDYPVDIEFTANFTKDHAFKVNLLQCRPLQTRGLGKPVALPSLADKRDCFFASKGNFMGGNVRLPIDAVVFVRAKPYLALNNQGKYAVARQIGKINAALEGQSVMLMGPGRWGTTTPSLGVPVHFTELSHMSVICEVASREEGMMPELSYGSHFFQDLVETGIFYVALFDGRPDVVYHPERILERENELVSLLPDSEPYADVIHLVRTPGMEIFSDIVSQQLLCR